ncbi:CPBP family intramembrane glutamic endopeptidase [Paenibacillus sp. FSL R10-2734]|uniref:CPBP family intramembrane glutamic endopeptidase n=1 Tax=Paenibacillus sp. FSL R10-2734 TaxID=2954691 RepID=UPI0030DAC9F5
MKKSEHQLRVTPKVWIGLLITVGYLCIILPIQKLSGIPYQDFGASADNLYRSAVMSMAAGAVALIIVTSLLGWWRPALYDSSQQRWTYKWPIIAPFFMLLGAIANLFSTKFSNFDAKFILILIVFGLLVGFCEELTIRGLLLTSLRSRLSEGWVCILTSIIFGLIHGSNIFLGQDVGSTSVQMLSAAVTGLTLYILRRTTGSLIWAMLLHGLWDVAVFMAVYNNADSGAIGGLCELASGFLSVLFLIIVFIKLKKATAQRR